MTELERTGRQAHKHTNRETGNIILLHAWQRQRDERGEGWDREGSLAPPHAAHVHDERLFAFGANGQKGNGNIDKAVFGTFCS